MDKKYVVQVAQTVREQLIATTRMEILMSWGIGQFTPAIFKDLPGLKFHVNGRLFQGDVLICLNGSDYYEVYLRDGTLIDRRIESGTDKEEYARFCEQTAMSLRWYK